MRLTHYTDSSPASPSLSLSLFLSLCAQNLVTVWSAPNYCYRCGNVAAILQFDDNLSRNFLLFNEVAESEQSMPSRTAVPYFL